MIKMFTFLAVGLLIIHGLIHLMGFVAYWPLAEVNGLPYKTALIGERLKVGAAGMRLYSLFWLITALGLVISAGSLASGQSWWFPVMWAAVIVSLLVTLLDWQNTYRGAVISLLILVPLLLIWGLRIQPKSFGAFPQPTPALTTVPLPADLPAPVARYYRVSMGEDIPVINSAVLTLRGTTRVAGITFPARLRFIHEAGQAYRHDIEATIFGYPLLKVNERYLDGQARLALPTGVVENEPNINMAANLGLWGESLWLPSIYLTDERVRWQAIDDTTALLIVPFEDRQDTFTATFDPETGLLTSMEALRYRDAADEAKIPWRLDVLAWGEVHDMLIPTQAAATWADEGTPWLIVEIDEAVYNVAVGEYFQNGSLTPPADYQMVAEIDLQSGAHEATTLGQFTLEETAVVSIRYTLPDLDSDFFELSLVGPAAEPVVILRGEAYRTDRNGGGTWESSLGPGTYRLALTAAQSPGKLSIFWRLPQ